MAKYEQSRYFFLILFIAIGYLSYLVLQPFLGIILLALITVAVFEPMYELYFNRVSKRKTVSTFLTILSIILIVVIPIIVLADIVYQQALVFNEDVQEIISGDSFTYDSIIEDINEALSDVPGEYELTEEEVREGVQEIIQPVSEYIVNRLIILSSSTFTIIANTIVYFTLLASLLPNTKRIMKFVKEVSPLPNNLDMIYITRVRAMTVSMVQGTFIVAIVQGLVSGVFFYIAGVPYVAFWTLLVIFFSIIPVGSGIITIPIGIFEIVTGNVVGGAFLILSNILIVTNIDNYLRPQLVSKDAQLHPALTLLGVLGGIQTFGFLGIVYGPVIMIMLVTSIEIYLKHYRA